MRRSSALVGVVDITGVTRDAGVECTTERLTVPFGVKVRNDSYVYSGLGALSAVSLTVTAGLLAALYSTGAGGISLELFTPSGILSKGVLGCATVVSCAITAFLFFVCAVVGGFLSRPMLGVKPAATVALCSNALENDLCRREAAERVMALISTAWSSSKDGDMCTLSAAFVPEDIEVIVRERILPPSVRAGATAV